MSTKSKATFNSCSSSFSCDIEQVHHIFDSKLDSITDLNTFIQRKRLRLESDETESPLKTNSACTVKSEFYFYEKKW